MKNKLITITIIFLLSSASIIPISVIGSEINSSLLEDIIIEYSFEPPKIKTEEINGALCDQIIMNNLPYSNEDGKTYLPVKPLKILLPYSTKVSKIKVNTKDTKMFNVINIKELKSNTIKLDPNQNQEYINNENKEKSIKAYKNLGVQYFRGFAILYVNLYPLQYQSNTNMLYYHDQITLTIETKQTNFYPKYYGSEEDKKEILKMVDNSEAIQTYNSNGFLPSCDYLIITTNDLKPTIKTMINQNFTFQDLIQQRKKQGLSCKIKTIEEINTSFNGIDLQEKIRNFIKYAYTNWGIKWILLGGDVEKVPIRKLYDIDGDDGEIPSDLYYSCLDGNFNFDNDSYWGEISDGKDGGWVDLYAEVYVGRAPVDDIKDVSAFVEKTLAYENSRWDDSDYLKNHLSVGEKVWGGQNGSYGAGYVERCIDYCTDYNHDTQGIPSDKYSINKLYERDENWNKNDIISAINAGVGIINHVAHGEYDHLGNNDKRKFYSNDIYELENEGKYSLFYSQACHAGDLEKDKCFAETWVNTKKAGGFAAIMNSGYGYGSRENYDGPSNRYAREFFDAIYKENKTRIGMANQDSKEDNIWRLNETKNHMYHVYYQTNLFGDPFVKIKTSKEEDSEENEKSEEDNKVKSHPLSKILALVNGRLQSLLQIKNRQIIFTRLQLLIHQILSIQ